MNEFNLELCMTRDGGRCKTRDGRNARIICTDRKIGKFDYPIVVLFDGEDGEDVSFYAPDGSYTNGIPSRNDLVNLSVKKQKWMNVYKEDLSLVYCGRKYFDSEEKAFQHKRNDWDYIKTILIHEWEQ